MARSTGGTVWSPDRLLIDDDFYLRKAGLHDTQLHFNLLNSNVDFLRDFLALAPGETVSLADVAGERRRIQDAVIGNKYYDYWMVSDEEVVGNVTMGRLGEGRVMFGYWLTEDAQFQGFATRATRRMMRHASDVLGMHHAEMWIQPDNEPSQAVATRLGAVKTSAALLPVEKFDIWGAEL